MAATTSFLGNLAPNRPAELAWRRIPRRPAQQVSFPRTPARPLVAGIPTSIRHVEKLGVGLLWLGDKGRAWALELKEYLEELPGVKMKVGLMGDTRSLSNGTVSAEEDDTQGVMREIISGSDVVCLLLPDMLQDSNYKNLFSLMKPNAKLAISDGFPPGQQRPFDLYNDKNISTFHANPEEIGTFIRDLDLNIQVGKINGAGTNSSLPDSFRSWPRQPRSSLSATKWSNPRRPAMERGRREKRPLRSASSRSAPTFRITGVIAGALLIWAMMGQGGRLLSMVGSFYTLFQEISPFAILLWLAALWLWYKGGNLLKCSGVLLIVFSAAVVAVSIAASLRKVQPTGAGAGAGSSTLPCDGARSGSCDPAACIHLTINGHQNNVNIYRP